MSLLDFSESTLGWLKLPWDAVVVHYGEVGLKGGNRRWFVRTLRRNLQCALASYEATVQDHFDRLLFVPPPDRLGEVLTAAAQVFGVAYAMPIRFLPREVEALSDAAVQTYCAIATGGESFAVRVRRADKTFPLTSRDLERLIGQRVVDSTGAPVNLNSPDILLAFRLYDDRVYLIGPKVAGVGGLPLGVTGKVLALLSGGIDSPVAAWLAMRRGCWTDFLHFHAFLSADEVYESKIVKLVEALVKPQGVKARLFLVPYHPFQLTLLTTKVPPSLELVLFRRFMVKVAERLANEHGYQGLVTGDNLGQVASQTLANLTALDDAIKLPILRPLLCYDKQEIVALAQRIGTYDLSIQPYKDCCSIIARHPETRAQRSAVQAAEVSLPMERIVEEALSELTVWVIGAPTVGGR